MNAADLCISLLPPALHIDVARLALEAGKHFVTTSYVSEPMKQLDDPARKAGLTFLNEVGTHTGVRGVLTTYVHYWVEVLHVILDAGIAQKQFRPINTQLLATVWEAGSMTLSDPDFLRSTQLSPRRIAEDWIDIVLNGILRK